MVRGRGHVAGRHGSRAKQPRRLRRGWQHAITSGSTGALGLGSPRPARGERSDRIARCDPGEGDSPRVELFEAAPHPLPLPAKSGEREGSGGALIRPNPILELSKSELRSSRPGEERGGGDDRSICQKERRSLTPSPAFRKSASPCRRRPRCGASSSASSRRACSCR
jgi:hypothetical protein